MPFLCSYLTSDDIYMVRREITGCMLTRINQCSLMLNTFNSPKSCLALGLKERHVEEEHEVLLLLLLTLYVVFRSI